MGEIATSNRQIALFYNSNSIRAKKTLAYASTEGLQIQEIEIVKQPIVLYGDKTILVETPKDILKIL